MTTWQHFHSVPAGSSYPTSPSEPIFANLSAFHEILSSVTLWQSHSFLFSYLRGVITRSRVPSPKYHCRSIFCFLLLLSPSQSRLAGLLLGISTILLHSPSRAIPSLSYTVLFEWYFSLCLNTFLPLSSHWFPYPQATSLSSELTYHILHIEPLIDDQTRWEAHTLPVIIIA